MQNGDKHTTTAAWNDGFQPDPALVETALEAVLSSEEFSGATRLQSFLRYVVEEGLAGRGRGIRAKTIAEDVYGRSLSRGPDPLAVVRVDAGRLRRRLTEYYANSGRDAPLRIHIDTGGYAPRFELFEEASTTAPRQTSPGRFPLSMPWAHFGAICVGCGIALAAFGFFWGGLETSLETEGTRSEPAELDALYATAPAKLQAVHLAEDARQLMFPVFDRTRLDAALSLFEQVVQLDPEYPGGFAGVGQIKAIAAAQMPASVLRDQFVSSALQNAKRAVDLAPTSGLSHSALAMSNYAAKDCPAAFSHSNRALSLSPEDLYVLNFDAIISLFCGEFERALRVSKPHIGTSTLAERLVFRNVAASAEFHLGDYKKSISRYASAIQAGSPVGALTVAYQAASYAELGQVEDAERTLELFAESWPELPIESVLSAIFVEQENAEVVLSALRNAGLNTMAVQ